MVVGSTRRERRYWRLTSDLWLLTDLPLRCSDRPTSEVPTFHCRQPDSDLVARLRFLFVRPCAARSSAQVTWTRDRGHPTVPGARWR